MSTESLPQVELLFDSLQLIRRQQAVAERQRDSVTRATFYEMRENPLLVTIVLVDSLRDSTASAVVLRRPGFSPQDVIAISARKLSAGALSAAVQELWRLRIAGGVTPGEPIVTAIRERPFDRQWGDQYGNFDPFLTALVWSDKRDIDGVGRGRAMIVTISPP